MGYCGPFTSESGYCERLKAFITANLQWVQEQMEKQPSSPYWYQVLTEHLEDKCNPFHEWKKMFKGQKLVVFARQVRLVLLQLKGLEDSYNEELSFPVGPFSFNPFGFL